jgi:hypothetical protein
VYWQDQSGIGYPVGNTRFPRVVILHRNMVTDIEVVISLLPNWVFKHDELGLLYLPNKTIL